MKVIGVKESREFLFFFWYIFVTVFNDLPHAISCFLHLTCRTLALFLKQEQVMKRSPIQIDSASQIRREI